MSIFLNTFCIFTHYLYNTEELASCPACWAVGLHLKISTNPELLSEINHFISHSSWTFVHCPHPFWPDVSWRWSLASSMAVIWLHLSFIFLTYRSEFEMHLCLKCDLVSTLHVALLSQLQIQTLVKIKSIKSLIPLEVKQHLSQLSNVKVRIVFSF